jgi:hypothetical protein
MEKKRSRGRRRPRRSEALAPIVARSKLDLGLPAEVPLSDREREEITQHLELLSRYKSVLRLDLNATEDRLVNGTLRPEDRGVVKHLLKKIDRSAVERALAREPLKSSAVDRARFLGGVVRLDPSLPSLVGYLEAVAATKDKGAARALGVVAARVDFAGASDAQVVRMVELATTAFEGHELVSAVLALVSSPSFAQAAARAKDRLSMEAWDLIECVAAAERAILRGAPMPDDEALRARVARGAERLCAVPEAILRAYPEEVRARLAAFAADRDPLGAAVRALVDSLPHAGDAYPAIALGWAEVLLARGQDARAKGVLEQVAQAHPERATLRDRIAALGWPKLGRVTLMPGDPDPELRIRQGFWIDGSAFAWIRIGAPADRERIEREGDVQGKLTTPGVLPALATGVAEDGTPYVVVGRRGKPMIHDRGDRDLGTALDLARAGILLLKALAREGVELPDAEPRRFALVGRSGLELYDLDGAKAIGVAQADLGHGLLAHRWAQAMLGGRSDLSAELSSVVMRRVPVPVLLRAIDLARARIGRSG